MSKAFPIILITLLQSSVIAYAQSETARSYASTNKEGSGSRETKNTTRTVPSRKSTSSVSKSYDHLRDHGASRPFVMQAVNPTTLELSDGQVVQLIGVSVPVNMTQEATSYLETMCIAKSITLEYGKSRKNRDEVKPVYAFLMDGEMVNAELIKQGYARVQTESKFSRLKEFQAYEREAQAAGLGLWAE